MGIDFVIGLIVGAVAMLLVSVAVVTASRRGAANAAEKGSAEGDRRKTRYDPQKERIVTGNTMIVEKTPSRENRFENNVEEIRELLLALAGVVGSAESASGRANAAFASTKESIRALNTMPSDISDAQDILIGEIDRLLKSNAQLHSELDRANRGIAEQRRQIEELRVQVRIDALTRIPNRAAFDERMQEYTGLCRRSRFIFSVLLLDIDHFKEVNDEFGHIDGDRILRGVAARIVASVRTNDFAARYGGEEFAVILPGTDLANALVVAERIREGVYKTNFLMDDRSVKITVSGGLAQCGDASSTGDVIAAADAMLYRAKKEGRNRIVADTTQKA